MNIIGRHVQRMSKSWMLSGLAMPYFVGGFTTTSAPLVITPAFTPQNGDFIIVQLSASNIIDPAAITPPAPTGGSSWSNIISSPGRLVVFQHYVNDVTGETSSYTFTHGYSSGLAWNYFILRGISPNSQLQTLSAYDTFTYPGTFTKNLAIPYAGIVVSFLGKNTTTVWNAGTSSGWTTISSSGQAKTAYKIVTDASANSPITWALSPPGSTDTITSHIALLYVCKYVQS